MLSAEEISKKLKTFAHTEFSADKFSSVDIIKEKMQKGTDLFERGHKYEAIKINKSFPEYLLQNISKFKEFINI